MATQQRIKSELAVLQEAVASAVHELSQPLNVVNLLADNVLDDVATLQETAAADAALLDGLRRRVESIIEQAGKASDITRWIRAFAVGIGGDVADFDPDAAVERVAGIFTNDLRVAGIDLVVAPAPGTRWASGDEALFAFALTEAVLWLGRSLPQPPEGAPADGSPGRRIRIACAFERKPRGIVVVVDGDVLSERRTDDDIDAETGASPAAGAGKPPQDLPLLAQAARAPGCAATLSRRSAGGVRIRISLPVSDLQDDAFPDGSR